IYKLASNATEDLSGRRVLCDQAIAFAMERWRDIHADIIHAHDLDSLFIGWLLKTAFGSPLIFSAHRAPTPWRQYRFQENPKDCFMEVVCRSRVLDGLITPSNASMDVLHSQGFSEPTVMRV